jgi:alanyl-tRNA synthetase
LDKTPFYAESGGQISDLGILVIGGDPYRVVDVKKLAGGTAIGHVIEKEEGMIAEGTAATAEVDTIRRYDIMRNHSATHLAHAALRTILGEHVHQAGSLVTEDRLRFDFSHYQKVSDEEIRDIEALVNEKIREATPLIHHRNIPFDDAKKMGALMFFGDKYGTHVNVVDFGPFSREFCGGTHIPNTAEIGLLKFIHEGSIASGTRRIEAVTGRGIDRYISEQLSKIDTLTSERERLEEEKRKLEKEIARLNLASRKDEAEAIIASALPLEGTKVKLATKLVMSSDGEEFKSFAEMVQSSMGNGAAIVLGSEVDGKASLVALVSDDVAKEKKIQAGKLVGAVAEIVGGKGGGRPNFAQAGGKDPAKLEEALSAVGGIIRQMVS